MVANADQLNTDGDAQGNACDSDDDNDGLLDGADNCPVNSNAGQLDTDGDSQGDACDLDDDNDGVVDTSDKLPLDATESVDTDSDGIGNNADTDDDNDGLLDDADNCPVNSNAGQLNTDGDSQGDICDLDDDNDGVNDGTDAFPLNPAESVDTDHDGAGNNADADDDNDGRPDVSDDCPLVAYLDCSFDSDGIVTPTGTGNDSISSVIQQADGKLVVAGKLGLGFGLARFNLNGALDTTFSGDGILTTSFGSSGAVAYSVIQQQDGKLAAAGDSRNSSGYSDFALARYGADGALDVASTKAIGTASEWAQAIIQQQDGKLLAVGPSSTGSQYDFALVRYNADGSLDSGFDGDGVVLTTANGVAFSVIQQADGKLVVAGGMGNNFGLARYNLDGSLDTTFAGDGTVVTSLGAVSSYGYSVIQQADGKLVVAGSSWNGSNNDFALARYMPDGSLDTTFSGDGKLITSFGSGDDAAQTLIQQQDGKLVAAGYSGTGVYEDFALVRYKQDGSLDTSFGVGGKLIIPVGTDSDRACSLIQQADGKLVLAGYSKKNGNPVFALVRIAVDPDADSDGTADADDNCPLIANAGQLDGDSDGVGDACDVWPDDTDNDGASNNLDTDDDNDGVPDYIDAAPLNATNTSEIIFPVNNNYKGSAVNESQTVQ